MTTSTQPRNLAQEGPTAAPAAPESCEAALGRIRGICHALAEATGYWAAREVFDAHRHEILAKNEENRKARIARKRRREAEQQGLNWARKSGRKHL